MTIPNVRRFATELEGLTLPGGWKVVARLPDDKDATGGVWSEGYFVEREGAARAFLKAFDLSKAYSHPNVMPMLELLTKAYNDEVELLERCNRRGLNRVVIAIDSGAVYVEEGNLGSFVPFIVFECADGDVRRHINLAREFDVRWALRALHHIANGIQQLHRERIAHQDLKPSNVMMFENGTSAKVGDLGRAAQVAKTGQFDHMARPGDQGYAPPESLYNVPFADWTSRLASDAYQMGSMIAFVFTGLSMTALWIAELDPAFHPEVWGGSFPAVLPYVREAFDRAVERVKKQIPADLREPLVTMMRRLCDPDPSARGHPVSRRNKHGNPVELDRFVTDLDLLSKRADATFIRHGV